MSHYGPFETRVGLYQRYTNFIDLIVRNTPDAGAYRLWGAPTLNDAYGNLTDGGAGSGVGGAGPTEVLVVSLNGIGQTLGASRAGVSKVPENRKGQTSFQVDPRDIPFPDENLFYARLQERRFSTGAWLEVVGPINNGTPILGPILVVPSQQFFQHQAGSLMLSGKAPSNTGCTMGVVPVIDVTVQTPLPMHIIFPRPASSLNVFNSDAVGDLLVSYGVGQPMFRIPQGGSLVPGYGHGYGSITELLLARETGDGGCEFQLEYMTANALV